MEDLTHMALPDADALARDKIEYHRQQMTEWREARARRLAAARAEGKSIEEIAAEVGAAKSTIYAVLRAAPDPPAEGKRRGRPRTPKDAE